MKAKIDAIIKILFSDKYAVLTKSGNKDLNICYSFSDKQMRDYGYFMYGFFGDCCKAMDEVNDILK